MSILQVQNCLDDIFSDDNNFNHEAYGSPQQDYEKECGGMGFMDMMYEAGISNLTYKMDRDQWMTEAVDLTELAEKLKEAPPDKPIVGRCEQINDSDDNCCRGSQRYIICGPLICSLLIKDYDLTEKILDSPEKIFVYGYTFRIDQTLGENDKPYHFHDITPARVGTVLVADMDIPAPLLQRIRDKLYHKLWGENYIDPKHALARWNRFIIAEVNLRDTCAGSSLDYISGRLITEKIESLCRKCPDIVRDMYWSTIKSPETLLDYIFTYCGNNATVGYKLLSMLLKLFEDNETALFSIISQMAPTGSAMVLSEFSQLDFPADESSEKGGEKTAGYLIEDFKWLFERVKTSRQLTICFARTLLYILSGIVYRSRHGYFAIDGDDFKKRADKLMRALLDMLTYVGKVNGKDVMSRVRPENLILDEKDFYRCGDMIVSRYISKSETLKREIMAISIYRQVREKKVILSRDHRFVRNYIGDVQNTSDNLSMPFSWGQEDISREEFLRDLIDVTDRFEAGKKESGRARTNRLNLLAQMKDDEIVMLAIKKNYVDNEELSQVMETAMENGNHAIVPVMLAYMD